MAMERHGELRFVDDPHDPFRCSCKRLRHAPVVPEKKQQAEQCYCWKNKCHIGIIQNRFPRSFSIRAALPSDRHIYIEFYLIMIARKEKKVQNKFDDLLNKTADGFSSAAVF
jgi:hypothetical protein